MHELRDNDCPFCRSLGTVEFFEKATALYSTLYKCQQCTSVFDAREKEQEERSQRKEQLAKLEMMKEVKTLPTSKHPKKKGSLIPKVAFLTVVLLIIIFST